MISNIVNSAATLASASSSSSASGGNEKLTIEKVKKLIQEKLSNNPMPADAVTKPLIEKHLKVITDEIRAERFGWGFSRFFSHLGNNEAAIITQGRDAYIEDHENSLLVSASIRTFLGHNPTEDMEALQQEISQLGNASFKKWHTSYTPADKERNAARSDKTTFKTHDGSHSISLKDLPGQEEDNPFNSSARVEAIHAQLSNVLKAKHPDLEETSEAFKKILSFWETVCLEYDMENPITSAPFGVPAPATLPFQGLACYGALSKREVELQEDGSVKVTSTYVNQMGLNKQNLIEKEIVLENVISLNLENEEAPLSFTTSIKEMSLRNIKKDEDIPKFLADTADFVWNA